MARQDPIALAATLPCWGGRVSPVPLAGGLTNDNFLVEDGGERYVVRVGGDIPAHNIVRTTEAAASRAAHFAGVSPRVHYADSNALVIGFVEGRTLKPREIAAVELHALDDIELGLRCLRLFDRNNTLVADFLHSVGDHLADGLVAIRSDRADLGDLFGGLHLLRSALDVLDDRPATAMSTPRFRSIGFIPALVSTPASQQAPPYTRARREGVRTGRLLELFGNHISL
jgi:hypothetical protein